MAALAGIVEFLLRRQGFPMAPLVIGMALGPTQEISLRQGLILTDDRFSPFFVSHPIAVFFRCQWQRLRYSGNNYAIYGVKVGRSNCVRLSPVMAKYGQHLCQSQRTMPGDVTLSVAGF
jgi:hypothetical protein